MSRLNQSLSVIALVLGLVSVWAQPVRASGTDEPTLKVDESDVSNAEFRKKLTEMSTKIENSIQVLREQIAESQSAPFLEDLYQQLAELLSQKSNTLYYIQMEKTGGDKSNTALAPVIAAQKEAITVYEKILKEFPNTDKKAQIRYRLALTLKSIGEIPAFMKAAGEVVHDYPGSAEALRTELLLGQYYFEQHEYPAALTHFARVADTSYVYERDLARYRMGLILLDGEHYQQALDRFEQVITDAELKERDNPYSVSLKSKTLKSDLKREALVDSVRAYTQLHGKGGDPVGYYSRIAPSELHFQEVIEKLAVRYIFMKNYDEAVKLLRSLSERTADPQRVVNIYREVLVMIPIRDRAEIPVTEMRFVLEQYHRWVSFFQIKKETRQEAYDFFEKEIRELATRNHALAKETKESKKYLEHARDYYLLYLGNFEGSPESSKMAANLADVYFAQQDWVRSGEYYLRTYVGEYGAPDPSQKEALIQNAILCLQKDGAYSFYQTVRRRGLMIRSLDSYIASSEQKKHDPSLAFLRAKTRYEQGIFPDSLDDLLDVTRRFPASAQAAQSGELILDYFNVRNDYAGLAEWSGKILAAKPADSAFRQKLANIEAQSENKLLQTQVRKVAGYDEFAQGRSYLQAGLTSSDGSIARLALREALAKSKEEQDLETYLQTATVLGQREKDPAKRAEILESVAQEDRKVGRYFQAIGAYQKIYQDPTLPSDKRLNAFDQSVQTAVLIRNWHELVGLSQNGMWQQLPGGTLAEVKQAWNELLESPIAIPDDVAGRFASLDSSDEGALAVYKAKEKLSPLLKAKVEQDAAGRCQNGARSSVCRWESLAQLDVEKAAYQIRLDQGALTLEGVQQLGPESAALLQKYQKLAGSGDVLLEIAVQSRSQELYQGLAAYLRRVGSSHAELKDVLVAKAKESEKAAQTSLKLCKTVSFNDPTKSRYCESSAAVPELLAWHDLKSDRGTSKDPDGDSLVKLQKKLFSSPAASQSELAFEVSKELFDHKDYHHAIALAAQGLAKNPGKAADYNAILGCSARELGYLQEASYRLKKTNRSCDEI